MKRVFVGGLFPEVTEKEIRDRFGRFGDVSGVEIKRKKNGEDSSEKIFAYVNLNISEENLSKCFSVYNKTKWRGSQLKLQLAKEDFLKRLSKERENGFAVEPKVKRKKGMHNDPLKNQEGIEDFHMRGAVPGTSIEGEENWVVGKYGRVLPIVHIPSKHGKKIVTVDPSKFCHNVKKVKEEEQGPDNCDTETLTWALKEENPEKTKKRIGDVHSTSKFVRRKCHQTRVSAGEPTQRLNGVTEEEDDLEVVSLKESTGSAKLGACAEEDSDSDYESMKTPLTKDKNRISASVTGHSLKEKNTEKDSKHFNSRLKETASKKDNSLKNVHDSDEKSAGVSSGVVNFMEDESDKESVSSADTDVIVAKQLKKNSGKIPVQSKRFSVTQGINEFSDGLTMEESRSESSNFNYESDDSLSAVGYERLAKRIEREYQRKFNSDPENHEGNLDFEVAGTSLKKSTPNTQKTLPVIGDPKTKRTMKSELVSEQTNNDSVLNNSVLDSDENSPQVSSEENLFSSASESSREDDRQVEDTAASDEIVKKSKSSSGKSGAKCVFLPFKGTSSLYSSDVGKNQGNMCNSSDQDMGEFPTEKERNVKKVTSSSKGTIMVDSSIKNTKNSMEGNETKTQGGKLGKSKKDIVSSVQSGLLEEGVRKSESKLTADVERSNASDRKRVESMKEKMKKTEVTADVDIKERSKAADRKRVESMMERAKETELKKRAIQQALKLNSKEGRPNKKIVFESDSSDAEDKQMEEGEEVVQTANKTNTEREKKPALFDSSSDEASDEDADEERFRIRPEFEGKAGKKLMKLQSRYKNDERFKLDEKFMDESGSEKDGSSDEEEEGFKPPTENDDEKSRALKILEEVVGSKALKKVQKKKTLFKDVSAIHFDPTKEDHKQFEMEPQQKKKKVKTVQRKMSASSDEDPEAVGPDRHEEPVEEEEVPEVTKDRFYEVSSDSFRETFSNKTSGVADSQFSLLSVFGRQQQQTTDSDEEMPEVEQIGSSSNQKADQFLWKQHVDSSDENMTSDEETETNIPVNVFTSSQSSFFFAEDDERIKEGIQEFCRKEDLETIREKWLEKRQNLVHAYTTKHKSLSRKKRIAQKNKRRRR